MDRCIACGKLVFRPHKLKQSLFCNSCASAVNMRDWIDRDFKDQSDLLRKETIALTSAKNANFSTDAYALIQSYFDEYIDNKYIKRVNGKAGQIIKVFEKHCIIRTESVSMVSEKVSDLVPELNREVHKRILLNPSLLVFGKENELVVEGERIIDLNAYKSVDLGNYKHQKYGYLCFSPEGTKALPVYFFFSTKKKTLQNILVLCAELNRLLAEIHSTEALLASIAEDLETKFNEYRRIDTIQSEQKENHMNDDRSALPTQPISFTRFLKNGFETSFYCSFVLILLLLFRRTSISELFQIATAPKGSYQWITCFFVWESLFLFPKLFIGELVRHASADNWWSVQMSYMADFFGSFAFRDDEEYYKEGESCSYLCVVGRHYLGEFYEFLAWLFWLFPDLYRIQKENKEREKTAGLVSNILGQVEYERLDVALGYYYLRRISKTILALTFFIISMIGITSSIFINWTFCIVIVCCILIGVVLMVK